MMSEIEEEPGLEAEKEIPMYCCLEFSFAVYYKFITIDMDRNSIKIDLKSTLTLSEPNKQGIVDRLRKEPLGPCDINPDYLEIMFCPWCGLHKNNAVDFDKGARIGEYSSKEGWER
jgi:hypothetical protein